MRLAPLEDFANLDGVVHLAAGSESPPLRTQLDAITRWYAIKGAGGAQMPQAAERSAVYQRCKAEAATLLGVPADDLAFVSSTAEGASQVAHSLPWRAGDNVVVEDAEFLSSLLPWSRLGPRGVEVRVVRHAAWTPDEAEIAAAVDERTRVIAVSQVNYLTGVHRDLARLRALADRTGALLYADVTHAAGAVQAPAAICDFAVSSTYKWLLGLQGVAVLMWNRARVPDLEPAIAGWRSVDEGLGAAGDPLSHPWKATAERLEAGSPPFLPIFYLEAGLRYLNGIGIERIDAHVRRLSGYAHERLTALGLPLATPAEAAYRAGNVCVWWENAEAAVTALAAAGVRISGYGGRIRISTHLWNDETDVDACIAALTPPATRSRATPAAQSPR